MRLSKNDFAAWRAVSDDPVPTPDSRKRRPTARPMSERIKAAPPLSAFTDDRPKKPLPVPPVGLPSLWLSPEENARVEREIQAVGIHRAFCSGWKRREPCGECDRLLKIANAARARVGLGPREDPEWLAQARRAGTDAI